MRDGRRRERPPRARLLLCGCCVLHETARGLEPAGAGAQAVVGRSNAQVTAERLGELRRLAVPDPAGDFADGQRAIVEQPGRTVHADPRQVLAERGVADLGIRTLKLTTR